MEKIPKEIWKIEIFSYLNEFEHLNIRKVCKNWNEWSKESIYVISTEEYTYNEYIQILCQYCINCQIISFKTSLEKYNYCGIDKNYDISWKLFVNSAISSPLPEAVMMLKFLIYKFYIVHKEKHYYKMYWDLSLWHINKYNSKKIEMTKLIIQEMYNNIIKKHANYDYYSKDSSMALCCYYKDDMPKHIKPKNKHDPEKCIYCNICKN